MPTLLLNGQMVPPAGAMIYYRRKTPAPLRAFPAGFKLIAGDQRADFFNAWRQRTLVSLVTSCLNALRHCGRDS